jgi:hypothetical protein
MSSNPDPDHSVFGDITQSPIMIAHSHGKTLRVSQFFKMKRGMPVILSPEVVLLIGELLNFSRQSRVELPKPASAA